MSRKSRIHYPGAFYHVILRGNAGDPIFFSDRDRYRLYLILQYAVEKFRCRIHAFCLMRNHIHLVVQAGDVPLSQIMQNISLRFTRWINHSQSRTGHIFQGRYKAILLDADAYLLELVRYVHLNPVRAGAAKSSEDYPWTGHRTYLGIENIPWLTTDFVLSLFASSSASARPAYASFVRDGMGEGRRGEYHRGTCQGRILGDETFADDVLDRVDQKRERKFTLEDVVHSVCSCFGISEAQLKTPGKARPMAEARAVAAAIVQITPHLRLTDLGKLLGRDVSALGKAAQRTLENDRLGETARKLVEELPGQISKTQA